MGDKRGISATVAIILIVLVTVAAVAIIWVAVVPMIRDNAVFQTFDINLVIETEGGYTFYDSDKGMLCLQVRRGGDEVNLSRIEVEFVYNGTSLEDPYNFSGTEIPSTNEAKTSCFNLSNQGGVPDSASIAPVFISGNKEIIGDPTSKIDSFKEGVYTSTECSATVPCPSTTYSTVCDGSNNVVNRSTSYSCVGGSCAESSGDVVLQDCGASGGTCSAGVCQSPQYSNPISSCGETLSTPSATYDLDQNIDTGGVSGTCLTITADNVILNLNGFNIEGSGSPSSSESSGSDSGIYVSNVNTFYINGVGGTISGFTEGIYAYQSKGENIDRVRVEGNHWGIYSKSAAMGPGSSYYNYIQNSHMIDNSGYGIVIEGGDGDKGGGYYDYIQNNTIKGNRERYSGYGIGIFNSPAVEVISNDIGDNYYGVVYYDYSNYGVISGNNITDNSYPGIYIYNSYGDSSDENNYFKIEGNNISDNGNYGVEIENGDYLRIYNNEINDNQYGGIVTNGWSESTNDYANVDSNRISGNGLVENSGYGIKMVYVNNWVLGTGGSASPNNISNNYWGINIGDGSNFEIKDTIVCGNSDKDLYCDSGASYSGTGSMNLFGSISTDCTSWPYESDYDFCPGVCPDNDGDGYTNSLCGGEDCNDKDENVKPGVMENCNDGQDNNCDGYCDYSTSACWDGSPYTGDPVYCLD
ncbi:hypothetical protein HOA55_00015 [archaeon]|jgi:parallel beta-helix repeat protein|nr:hypothetical protein [archaeon]MBT3577911.1 hypothetical protein [archaeon]MBT6819725.1 hypothetical protein [archaeon]MBT6956009.1 hypothetical protein [archaeon]MBT7025508.1 hypothetical protein [archaeon]